MPEPVPLSAEFESYAASKLPGMAAPKYPWKLSRSSSGKSSVDYGNRSVINDPQAQQTITLDHVKKEAFISPLPSSQAGQAGTTPGAPAAPAQQPPQTPPMDVKDLGKKMIVGHEAEGKLYTFRAPHLSSMPAASPPQPPQQPQPPQPQLQQPQPPQQPQQPSAGQPPQAGSPPALPKMPALPKLQAVHLPHAVEVWTGSKIHLPLLTKSGSSMTQQVTSCKQVQVGEPHPSAFQIPPGYKIVHAPSLPHFPGMPHLAKPHLPGLPHLPKLPHLPHLPK